MLTIGGFAGMGGVSARMLRHYDEIGLLHPAYTGQNGYRYYDTAQLAVLRQIERLKSYGFLLAEIKDMLPLSEGELTQRIHARRLKAYGELHQLKASLRKMEEDMMEMEGTGTMNEKYDIIVMDAPAQKVFGLRRKINISETHDLFQALYAEMEKRGLKRAGATQLAYMGEEFSYENMDVEAQAEVLEDGDGIKVLPAGTFVVTTHIGPYESVRYAYEAIWKWLEEHPEYEATGNGVERYIKDEAMVQSPEELETGVLFPVRKK